MNNVDKTIYNIGYKNGFDDGLKAARDCSNCEYIKKCEDDIQKTDYCPNANMRYR
jgi:hypothetical protein